MPARPARHSRAHLSQFLCHVSTSGELLCPDAPDRKSPREPSASSARGRRRSGRCCRLSRSGHRGHWARPRQRLSTFPARRRHRQSREKTPFPLPGPRRLSENPRRGAGLAALLEPQRHSASCARPGHPSSLLGDRGDRALGVSGGGRSSGHACPRAAPPARFAGPRVAAAETILAAAHAGPAPPGLSDGAARKPEAGAGKGTR